MDGPYRVFPLFETRGDDNVSRFLVYLHRKMVARILGQQEWDKEPSDFDQSFYYHCDEAEQYYADVMKSILAKCTPFEKEIINAVTGGPPEA